MPVAGKQWNEFKDDFKIRLKNVQSTLPNYFDSKKWNYVIAAIVASFILIPIVLYSLNNGMANIKKITPSLLVFFGTGATFIGSILFNRQNRDN